MVLVNVLSLDGLIVGVLEVWMCELEELGYFDCVVDIMLLIIEMNWRMVVGERFVSLELCILLVWMKIVLCDVVLVIDLLEDFFVVDCLVGYFLLFLRERFIEWMLIYWLYCEIIMIEVVNCFVDL